MHYRIYCNEKHISDNYFKAFAEFEKRLSAYCNTTLHITKNLPSSKEIARHAALSITPNRSTGSSTDFAAFIDKKQQTGTNIIYIFIGYDDAPSTNTYSITQLSLSNETLTLLFLEQLYRGYTILQGKTYHK